MDETRALAGFAALSQETRLRIIRMLVRSMPEGLPAGSVADAMGVSASNISFHLKELEYAGLAIGRREARSIIYTANFGTLAGLLRFLTEECCGGHPEICKIALSSGEDCK